MVALGKSDPPIPSMTVLNASKTRLSRRASGQPPNTFFACKSSTKRIDVILESLRIARLEIV
jgi:hypothetical protein